MLPSDVAHDIITVSPNCGHMFARVRRGSLFERAHPFPTSVDEAVIAAVTLAAVFPKVFVIN